MPYSKNNMCLRPDICHLNKGQMCKKTNRNRYSMVIYRKSVGKNNTADGGYRIKAKGIRIKDL
jgi:hypothetical protein